MAADISVEQATALPTTLPAVVSTVASESAGSSTTIHADAVDGVFGDSGMSPQAMDSAANALVQEMKASAEATGRVALNAFDELATFAGITIESPAFQADGSFSGTSQFGDSAAPVLLQYISATGSWALANETDLPSLVPADSGFQSPIELQSPYLVFSTATVDISSGEMSAGATDFYGRIYESDNFTVRLQRGVNLLSRATIADDSAVDDILGVIGIDIPAVELEGVVFATSNPTPSKCSSRPNKTRDSGISFANK
ncbi:hypothetical protein [Planctomycetes bacterium K23_9]|uniref:Uncharacterized protein n=1 Tax=Stieleria marina TaxID=1930275 RepID=A0A517NM72_9BACT|nr:hypothetical protein K239x_01050 [Planctomycetes bacterium K23_9]